MILANDNRLTQLQQWLGEQFNRTDISLSMVSGDASFRRYVRFEHEGVSYIGVDAPPDKEDSQPFVDVSLAYAEQGLDVPKVIHENMTLGFMCLSDLGDDLLLPRLNNDTVDDYYAKALVMLNKVAKATHTSAGQLPMYDDALLLDEMVMFTDWFLPKHLQLEPSEAEQKIMAKTFAVLVDNALAQTQVGVHRDYHSRNLMIKANNELATFDYQDAVIGGITYDAVSLLRDCYITWPDELVYRHLLAFKQNMTEDYPALEDVTDETFKRWFDLMGLQRHIKVCGVFSRLCYRDGKEGYLADIPRTLNYVIDVASKYPEFSDFVTFLTDKVKRALLDKAN